MPETSIVCSKLSFSWPDDTPVFQDLSFSFGPGRTGILAPNGAGKTTLLKLITGEFVPASGSIQVTGTVGYVSQSLPLESGRTVAEVMEIAPIMTALHAIEAGDTAEEHFTVVGNDWDIQERARVELDRLDLGDIGLNRTLGTLSGGQIVSLGLATQLLNKPDVLLLDEPTNNLDLDHRRLLYSALREWTGCMLVISHDRTLLDQMDRIAKLSSDTVRIYGGNFSAYEEAVELQREVAERNLRSAEQDVRQEKREAQVARERAQRRASNAAKKRESAGLPKIVAGALKRKAQESAGRSAEIHADRLGKAKAKREEADNALREDPQLVINLPETNVPNGRTVLHCEGVNISYDGQPLFGGHGFALDIRGPERIALTGGNGAGKSTMLRLISSELEAPGDTIRPAAGRIAWLSQRMDLLDPERTVAENLRRFAPDLADTQLRHLLAQFLFRDNGIHRAVGVLSGGELLRATLACVLSAKPAPQLLLLDEPTNNLDLPSVAQLESTLNAYEGAFVAVSHDERFLQAIGVERRLHLHGGQLRDVTG